jgi:N6-adenosine-specific RNA methylase IME4
MFNVLYADPPWSYRNAKTGGNHTSGAAQQYATLSVFDIGNIDLAPLLAKNGVCFLWVPVPLLPSGLWVLEEWGFRYKTALFWHKQRKRPGIGYWFRGDVEVLLFGVRGKVAAFRSIFSNVMQLPVLAHSAKPDPVRDLILSASLRSLTPRPLELFARTPYPGWTCTGLEFDGLDVQAPEWAEQVLARGRD